MPNKDEFDFTIEIPAHDGLPAEDLGFMLMEDSNGKKLYSIESANMFPTQMLIGDPTFMSVPLEQELPLAQTDWSNGMGLAKEITPQSAKYLKMDRGYAGHAGKYTHGYDFTYPTNTINNDINGQPLKFFKWHDGLYLVAGRFIYQIEADDDITMVFDTTYQVWQFSNTYPWLWTGAGVTGTWNTTFKPTGYDLRNYSGSGKLAVSASASATIGGASGPLASSNFGATGEWNAEQDSAARIWIYSSIDLSDGDLQLIFYNGADMTGISYACDIEAITQNTWTDALVEPTSAWSSPDTSRDKFLSVSLNLTKATLGAFDVYCQDLRAHRMNLDITDVAVYVAGDY